MSKERKAQAVKNMTRVKRQREMDKERERIELIRAKQNQDLGQVAQDEMKDKKLRDLAERKAANKPYEEMKKQREKEARERLKNRRTFKQSRKLCCRNCLICLRK
jgi:hypothetical protein